MMMHSCQTLPKTHCCDFVQAVDFVLPKGTSVTGQHLDPYDFFPLCPLPFWISRCSLFFYQHSGSNPAELRLCPDTDVSGLVLTTLSLAGEAPGYGWCGEATESVKYT